MKIKFVPQNIEVDVNPNKSVMHLAMENGIQIHSICKGLPSCAECRVKIVEGENNVSKPTKAELNLIGTSYYIDGRRLSCQVKCFGPVTIDTTEQIERVDNPAKKIRGFKSQKQYESKAVLDTMLLTETPPPVTVEEPQRQERQERLQKGEGQDRQHRHEKHGKQNQGGGRPQHPHQQNRQHQQKKNDNRRPQNDKK